MNIHKDAPDPCFMALLEPGQVFLGSWTVNGFLHVIVTKDKGMLHLSVSHPKRYPTWDEIRDIRYALLPNDKTFGLLLPPKEQYVNLHPNCFHLHELPQLHESSNLIILSTAVAL